MDKVTEYVCCGGVDEHKPSCAIIEITFLRKLIQEYKLKILELKQALKAQFEISGKCCYSKAPGAKKREEIEELLK